MRAGERQVAPTIDGIRRDHVARYEWAAKILKPGSNVIDFACGVGYGTHVLSKAGHAAYGFDIEPEAIEYAESHYSSAGTWFGVADGANPPDLIRSDAAVCFETIEHIEDPRPLLRALHKSAKTLLASVPNEEVFPWRNYAYHFRHYTPAEFEFLLRETGWQVVEWHGQEGPESEVEPGVMGRTIIAVCERTEVLPARSTSKPVSTPPKHVSIVGLGPSSAQYVSICKSLGGRHKYCDETWGINAFGDVLACDRIFHMDDVRIQEIRAEAAPDSNIAGMIEWMKAHPGPIVTSRSHPNYPGLVEFPLESVINEFPNGYFNSTAAYAVAYAIWLGVEKVSLFGCDFTYPNAHDAEKGRACVEFWLGIAAERGIKIAVPKTTSLLDALNTQAERFYGYDTLDLDIKSDGGKINVTFSERSDLPTAEEVEARYDHSAHPNPLVENKQ